MSEAYGWTKSMWSADENTEVCPFSSVLGLEGLVGRVDDAKTVALCGVETDHLPLNMFPIGGFQGVYNLGTKKVASVTSDQYTIIQHKDVLNATIAALHSFGHEVQGTLVNRHDRISVMFSFPDIVLNDESDGIEVGGVINNSYDTTGSFKGHAHMIRVVCTNGMTMRRILPETNFSVRHIGEVNDKVIGALETYYTGLVKDQSAVSEVIDAAMATGLEFVDSRQVEDTLAFQLGKRKHAANIVDQTWDGELETNKWDLYNAVTEYTSHTPMTYQVYDAIGDAAMKMLSPNTTIAPFVEMGIPV